MDWKTVVDDVVRVLLTYGVLHAVWLIARGVSTTVKGTKVQVYGGAILVCFGLAWYAYMNVGRHAVPSEDVDMWTATEYEQEFEPTDAERMEAGAARFLVLLPIVLHGVWYARNRQKPAEPAARAW